MTGALNACVNNGNESCRADEKLTPFRVELGRRFGRDGLLQCPTLLLQSRNGLTDRNEHVAEGYKIRPASNGPVPRDNDHLVRN